MFTVGTKSTKVIDLAEDSETISLMLGLIYPSGAMPIVNTFELLEKSLEVAQKYNIDIILKRIDHALSSETFYKDMIQSDPLRLFDLSGAYGLRESRTAAAKEVNPYHLNSGSVEGVL
jgi:hypothetical protein